MSVGIGGWAQDGAGSTLLNRAAWRQLIERDTWVMSVLWLTTVTPSRSRPGGTAMGAREDQRRRRERTQRVRRGIGEAFRQLRTDAGLTAAAVARASGISPSHYCGIERGSVEASSHVLVSVADVLGADLAIRAYPSTGPRIHDRIQARIVEELIGASRARWRTYVEVPVRHPARGYVDVVLSDRQAARLVATEVQSDLRRIEQQLRWAQEKAASLPSADLWRTFETAPVVSSILVLRSTERTRALVDRFPGTFAALYPARAAEVHAAITGDGPWLGPGILWARVLGDAVMLLPHPPRGVAFGR